MKIVFSVGGSLVMPDDIDIQFIKKFSSFVFELSECNKIAIVVGGGRIARKYINAADCFMASDVVKDNLGIEATHINAMLVASALGDRAFYVRRVSPEDLRKNKVVVTGGTTPGHSTDAVAAELAVAMDADLLVNASNVSGVYDKDPSKHPNARMLKKLMPEDLLQLISKLPQTPGKYALVDRVAAEAILKHGIRTIILDGSDVDNMKEAVEGRGFVGTSVE